MHRDRPALLLIVILPLLDLSWNLTHLNIGLVDFYGLSAFAQGYAIHGAWPATPYFPAGYPLLLIPFGYLGSTLVGGYILSALGIMLALYAAWMLTQSMGASYPAGVAAVVLCWLAPVTRVVAGSPSVDALYTGLGLWFLAAALTTWRDTSANESAGQGGLPRWAQLGLLLPSLLLPLLRYHAVILLAPVLLVLLLFRRSVKTAAVALLALALAIVFNYSAYYAFFHETQPPIAKVQALTGLELRFHKLYAKGDEYFWNNYPQFCRLARSKPLLSFFTLKEIATNWAVNWVMFLRQPSVFLLCIVIVAACIWRRSMPRGAILGFAWVAAYTFVLASAYYTARAAALPVMLAVALCLATVNTISIGRYSRWVTIIVLLCLTAGYIRASSFAMRDFRERTHWAGNSRWLDRQAQARQAAAEDIVATDWRFVPLHKNAWTTPYATVTRSWIDDPLIRQGQSSSIKTFDTLDLAAQHPPVQYVAILTALDESYACQEGVMAVLGRDQRWRIISTTDNPDGTSISIYGFSQPLTPVSGDPPAVP